MPRKLLAKPLRIPVSPEFTGFDDDDLWTVPGYERNLPHWRLIGATYFVTFRLADSIPKEVAARWKNEQVAWLSTHGVNLEWKRTEPRRFTQALAALDPAERAAIQHEMRRRFFIDLDQCHGCCALRHPEAQKLVAESLSIFHGQRIWLGDFVIMPNHVHVMVQPFEGVLLEDWLYSVKRFTATQMRKLPEMQTIMVTRSQHVWQPESFDRIIRDRAELKRTRDYIANNPRKLGAGDFVLHRAAWLDALPT